MRFPFFYTELSLIKKKRGVKDSDLKQVDMTAFFQEYLQMHFNLKCVVVVNYE